MKITRFWRSAGALSLLLALVLGMVALFPVSRPARAASSVPPLDHVIVIMEENKDFSEVRTQYASSMPYFNQTLVPAGALAQNYDGEGNNSLPNYLAMTYGQDWLAQTTNDPLPSQFSTSANNLGNTLNSAGKSWKAYMESMPSNCATSDHSPYVAHHNPFAYQSPDSAGCGTHDVPYSQFSGDLSGGMLPAFSFISPNTTDDGHTGPSIAAELANTDGWLQSNIPAILTSSTFQQSNTLVAIVWDEGVKSPVDNHVPMLFLGRSSLIQAGSTDNTTYPNGHYSFLHTVEVGLGLGTLTNNDANASLMSAMFAQPTQPTISSFSPTSGLVGASVDILGSGLTDTSTVSFNGTSASFTIDSDGSVDAVVPTGATSGPLTLTTANGSVTSSSSFTVTIPTTNPPVVNSLTPTSGDVGSSIILSGQYFTGATSVSFNGTASSFVVNNDSSVSAVVPPGATSGPVSITTANGTGTSSVSFTVTTTPPPSTNNILEDDFTRPNQAGFGTSTNTDGIANNAWANSVSTNANASITMDVGKFTNPGDGKVHDGWLGVSQSGAVDVLARVAFAGVGSPQFRLFADNAGANYAAELDTSANVLHVYYRDNSGAQHTIGTDFAFLFVKNTRYWVRLDVTASGTVAARLWQDGSNEPSTWQVSGTDTHLSSGQVGEGFSWATTATAAVNQSAFSVATGGNLAAPPDSGNPPPPPPASGLSVSGDTLIDSTGAVVVLRGFSQGASPLNTLNSWNSGNTASGDGTLSSTTLATIASWGANTVRIPVSAYICNQDGSNCANSGPYMTELQLDINQARTDGLYVLVAPFDDPKAGSPYTDHHYHPEDGTFLAQVAALYKSDSGVLYDIVNEPVYTSDSQWASDMNAAIALIRGAGASAPIVVQKPNPGTNPVCKTAAGVNVGEQQAFTSAEVGLITDPQIIFSDHRYHAVVNGDATSESCLLGAAAGIKPFLIGEWGVLPHADTPYLCTGLTNSNADALTNGFMNWSLTGNAGAAVSWTAWNFKPTNSIADFTSYTPTAFNTGAWSCDDGSAAAASAGEGSDIKTWLAAHP